MASTSQTNPAYDIPLFNACDHLIHLHQEITNFLHYQSHVCMLPPHPYCHCIPTTTHHHRQPKGRETIIKFLKEEHSHIKTLRQLLEMANDNNTELHLLFEDSPVNTDINWGELNWGLTLQWEQLPPQDE